MKYIVTIFVVSFFASANAQEASRTLIKSFRDLNCDSFQVAIPVEKVETVWGKNYWRTELDISINEKMGNILKTLIFSGRYSIEVVEKPEVCLIEFPGYKKLEKIGKLPLREELIMTIRKPAGAF